MEQLLSQEKKYHKLNIFFVCSIALSIVLGVLAIISFFGNLRLGPIKGFYLLVLSVVAIIVAVIMNAVKVNLSREIWDTLQREALREMNLSRWLFTSSDAYVKVKSKQAVDNYDDIKFFKEYEGELSRASNIINDKKAYARKLSRFLENNQFKNTMKYPALENDIRTNLLNTTAYNIYVEYISPAGRSFSCNTIHVSEKRINELCQDKSILMSKTEYNKYLKEQKKEELENKQRCYYEKVNSIIDVANDNRDILRKKDDVEELDKQIYALFDRAVNAIRKTKTVDSDEWGIIDKFIINTNQIVSKIIEDNQRIIDYYNSPDFEKIKSTCNSLIESQKEFNDYINDKAKSISDLFGTRVVRNETIIDDKYNYVRPYKKSITPFSAELSANVFASAENNPMDYIVKYFYPDKSQYPNQIQKLQLLVEELETLKDAKEIIENYKMEYQQYITDVPAFIMENDEEGFYSRLGFANITEEALTVEYRFSYTSDGGMARRSFTVPMTEETIVELINKLQSKLTMSAFVKEQRLLMTSKLRQQIKERDNYTCKYCGNSTYKEPNLLLEIDHIIPVSKGGTTIEENLQTLCWKCNREKSDKVVNEIG